MAPPVLPAVLPSNTESVMTTVPVAPSMDMPPAAPEASFPVTLHPVMVTPLLLNRYSPPPSPGVAVLSRIVHPSKVGVP